MRWIMLTPTLLLAACLTPGQQADTVAMVTKACKGEQAIHESFSALAMAKIVKGSIIEKEQAAHAGATVLCANPAALTDPYAALAQITATVIVVTQALHEAS